MKSRIAKSCVFLLLLASGGAIVNVAVAWGISQCAGPIIFNQVRVPRFGDFHRTSDNTWWSVTYLDEPGMAHISGWQRPDVLGQSSVSSPGRQFHEDQLPEWSRLRLTDERAAQSLLPSWREYARGWPMLSMFMRMEEDTTVYKFQAYHAVVAPFRSASIWQRPPEELLPIGLIWPGFAINTVFYAAVLWGLFAFPFALRRLIRTKRGLCPACGYPVGASDVCTECGKPVNSGIARMRKAEMVDPG